MDPDEIRRLIFAVRDSLRRQAGTDRNLAVPGVPLSVRNATIFAAARAAIGDWPRPSSVELDPATSEPAFSGSLASLADACLAAEEKRAQAEEH
jgi:hypothetical protein